MATQQKTKKLFSIENLPIFSIVLALASAIHHVLPSQKKSTLVNGCRERDRQSLRFVAKGEDRVITVAPETLQVFNDINFSNGMVLEYSTGLFRPRDTITVDSKPTVEREGDGHPVPTCP